MPVKGLPKSVARLDQNQVFFFTHNNDNINNAIMYFFHTKKQIMQEMYSIYYLLQSFLTILSDQISSRLFLNKFSDSALITFARRLFQSLMTL